MQGDFSRLTFDPGKQYRAVHMQQGRVQLDADWNEQVDIFNYALETQIRDLVGLAGGPRAAAGFQVTLRSNAHVPEQQAQMVPGDFVLSKGRYYVDGIVCENARDVLYTQQTDYPAAVWPAHLKQHAIVYLDVWLRHIHVVEDPALREIALGGIDTTTRTKTVWQAKILPVGNHHVLDNPGNVTYEQAVSLSEWHELLNRQKHRGHLRARLAQQSATVKNQLYRVEIHDKQGEDVTWKWSRENGSVVFEVQQFKQDEEGNVQLVVDVEDLRRDRTRLQKGDWVEIVDEETLLQGRVLPLYQVKEVPDYTRGRVTLKGSLSDNLELAKRHTVFLRRWDHDPANPRAGALHNVHESAENWIELENGLQVAFQPGGRYEIGDYWLIPARELSQSIEWPEDPDQPGVPLALPPRGIYHHYCPLALLARDQDGNWEVASDVRQLFAPLPVVSTLAEREPVSVTEIIEETPVAEQQVAFAERARTLVELCTSDEELVPGDLVALVPGSELQVTKARRENAQLVFGVVSGTTRDRAGEQRFLVTIYGRLLCKVTGSIAAGDLLSVSEEIAGCAAKVEQTDRIFRPGSILGKALDFYDGSAGDTIGKIHVMVTLQ